MRRALAYPARMTDRRGFQRYVAIGDSSTEGLDDPDGEGGYRGWSMRLAGRIAATQGALLYANLAIRGRRTRQIREQQLQPAVAMRPDLATVFSGTNDVVARRFDADTVASDMRHMQRALVAGGATVLTFTLPDITPVMPMARVLAPRIRALNAALRAAAADSGAILVDFAAYPVATDARLWSADRLHANAAGHARIADALAHALGLPGAGDEWKVPLPPPHPRPASVRLASEAWWLGRHLLPWMMKSLVERGGQDRRRPKRPELTPV